VVTRDGHRFAIGVTVVAPPEAPPRDETQLAAPSPLRGATVASLSPALAEELGADSAISGVVVLDAMQGSAAARLGLRRGDIIRDLDGLDIDGVSALAAFRVDPFKPWRMAVVRNEKIIAVGHRRSPAFQR
jgi:serine protease Do